MAKKNISSRKSVGESKVVSAEDTREPLDVMEPEVIAAVTSAAREAETPVSKPRVKTVEEPVSGGSVGLSDIRKAVAFSNSVGGLDKAMGLLQILKVAKEVQ